MVFFITPLFAHAQIESNFLKEMFVSTQITTISAGLSNTATLGGFAALLIRALLALLGVLFTFLIVYSGYLWLTASGNSEQTEKAKKLLISAIVGMIIVVAGYVISFYILEFAVSATQTDTLYYYDDRY